MTKKKSAVEDPKEIYRQDLDFALQVRADYDHPVDRKRKIEEWVMVPIKIDKMSDADFRTEIGKARIRLRHVRKYTSDEWETFAASACELSRFGWVKEVHLYSVITKRAVHRKDGMCYAEGHRLEKKWG